MSSDKTQTVKKTSQNKNAQFSNSTSPSPKVDKVNNADDNGSKQDPSIKKESVPKNNKNTNHNKKGAVAVIQTDQDTSSQSEVATDDSISDHEDNQDSVSDGSDVDTLSSGKSF
jgi:hypothetical protein